jgi:hypothetical protein
MSAVRDRLEEISLGQYAEAFEAKDIDMDLLAQVDDQLLKKLACRAQCHRQTGLHIQRKRHK